MSERARGRTPAGGRDCAFAASEQRRALSHFVQIRSDTARQCAARPIPTVSFCTRRRHPLMTCSPNSPSPANPIVALYSDSVGVKAGMLCHRTASDNPPWRIRTSMASYCNSHSKLPRLVRHNPCRARLQEARLEAPQGICVAKRQRKPVTAY